MGRLGRGRHRERSGFRCAKSSAPPNSSATRPRGPKAWSPRWSRTARKSTASAGESGPIVLNQTPFYGESGGQVGDTGVLIGDGVHFRVTETQKKGGDLFVHLGKVEQGTLKPGAALSLEVDHARRTSIRANHSATHLLHEALRQVLGDHIAQRGSLVAPDRLRFDFVHPKSISPDELARVEDIANDIVLENGEVTTRLMGLDDAREAGARALFGEKYGDEVRVVSMGKGSATQQCARLVGRTVRRHACAAHRRHRHDLGARRKRGRLRRAPHRGADRQPRAHHANHRWRRRKPRPPNCAPRSTSCRRVAALMEERKKLERELVRREEEARDGRRCRQWQRRPAASRSRRRQIPGAGGAGHRGQGSQEPGRRRQEADRPGRGRDRRRHRRRQGRHRGRRHADLTSRFSAVDLVRKGSEALGGKGGGGRPDMAQAGGPDGAKADAALSAIEQAMAGA